MDIKIPTVDLRPFQKEAFTAMTSGKYKRGFICCHRRAGKEIVAIEICLALAFLGTPGTILYANSTYRQIKETVWNAVCNNGIKMLDWLIPKELVKKKNNSEMYIEFINGSVLKFFGSDNYDHSAVGTNAKAIVFSEWSLSDQMAWQYTRPIIKMNDGIAIFIGTPRGHNHFYDMYMAVKDNPEWFVSYNTYKDTGLMTDEDYQKEIEDGMPESIAAQEFLCSFDTANEGSYYGKEIQAMRNDGRICSLPIDTYSPVCTAWDLGIADSTAIIFYQRVGDWLHIIDCFESNGASLKEYVQILREKGYLYDNHYFPHDINNRELGTGETRLTMLSDMGVLGDVVPMKSINYGIECVHRILSRTKINENKCAKLIKALEMYHKKFDEKNNVFMEVPVHDDSSHMADAMRMLSVAEREHINSQIGESKVKVRKRNDYNPISWNVNW